MASILETLHSGERPTCEQERFFEIAIGDVHARVSTRGGRITSFQYKGAELLTGPERDNLNFGSTFWSSPQSDWGWPPPEALDSQLYYVSSVDNTSVTVISEIDSKTGFQFAKTFTIDPDRPNRLQIFYTITNYSKESKFVAPWEVTRVKRGGTLFFPIGSPIGQDGAQFLQKNSGFSQIPYDVQDGIAWYLDGENHDSGALLSVADGEEGWTAYAIAEMVFIKKFPSIKAAHIAPGEGEVCAFVNSDAGYLEIEPQGRYQELIPGENLTWGVEWIVAEMPQTLAAGNSGELVKFVRNAVIGTF